MEPIVIWIGLVLISSVLAQATGAGEVRIPDTQIWFKPPPGFTTLSQDELDIKFPSKTAPRYAVGNERRTTTIAFDVRDVAVTTALLAAQVDVIGDSMGRAIPGFVSIDRGMRTLNDQHWAFFEMTSTALDADIHNMVLMAAHGGRMVVLNFNSTKADFVDLEPLLRQSIESLKVRE